MNHPPMWRVLGVASVWAAVWVSQAAGRQTAAPDDRTPAQADGGRIAVLDTTSVWRMFHVLKAPEIAFDDGVKPAVFQQYWLRSESSPPPADWAQPAFDDSEWLRGPAPMSCKTPFVARACFRGKFTVSDPERVRQLALTVRYQGGVVVYVNGREVRRAHVAPGAGATLAEPYPQEAFVGPGGVLLARERSMVMSGKKMGRAGKPDKEALRRMALQRRMLADVAVPAEFLRKGVNVLAVEIIRATYHKVVDEQKTPNRGGALYDMHWNTCELLGVQLSAAGPDGLEPNVARPDGFQVWNGSLLRADFELDFGDPCEALRPITITGVRNGTFSGKVIVGSTKPIKGLKASVGQLKGPGGAIPASALRVRYGAPRGSEYGAYEYMYGFGAARGRSYQWPRAAALGVLYDALTEEVPLGSPRSKLADGVTAVLGAVAPVWLTVKVPAGTEPGVYEGPLAIEAEGENPVTVPVRLEVLPWTLPEPESYKTWIELVQSPDTLQLEYAVEPWSERHWALIARSMRLLREVGSGIVYVPLLCETNHGNAESMVRWIRKGDKQFDFDFSVMDKYLDVAEENLGKPKVVCFITWEVYLLNVDERRRRVIKNRPVQPLVSMLDPATGKVTTQGVPNYDDPAMKPVWQALFAELRKRLKARGLEQAMTVGWMCDTKPSKEEVLYWREVTGDLPWVSHSHWPTSNKYYYGKVLGTGFKTGYMTSIYALTFPSDPSAQRLYGWKNPLLHAQNTRSPSLEQVPGAFCRCMGEINIAGGQRGFGRLGGDYWRAVKDKSGRRVGKAYDRYPQSSWLNINLSNSLLAPGPEGAVATTRFEVLREGLQECEARIAIERAFTDDALRAKLGDGLAARCETLLDERTLCVQRGVADFNVNCYGYYAPWNWMWQTGAAGHAWFQSSSWRRRGARLYALAGEVEKKLAAK